MLEYLLKGGEIKVVQIITAVLISFVVCIIIGPFLIPILTRLKFGQSILQIGPKWHNKKSGTPTMGGIIFIIAIGIACIFAVDNHKVLLLFILSLVFGAIGFIDDYIKVALKRNLGLTAKQKFTAQLIVATVFVYFIYNMGWVSGELIIPFMPYVLKLESWIYIPFTIFVILGTVNSVNLTDGLDGLASGITAVVAVFFTLVAYTFSAYAVSFYAAALVGGCIGFLMFNAHPAKVFMGDMGSLFLGGAVASLAIILELHFILIIVGGVFLLETLSVIMQVASFKLTGKRIFKMSPIHHHFEMIGWKETKVVTIFVLITIALCAIAFVGMLTVLSI